MLKNERQYNSARSALKAWERNLEIQKQRESDKAAEAWILDEERFAIEQQIAQLSDEIREYEDLLAGKRPSVLPATMLDDLPKILIMWRIFRRWTQKDLAARLGMQENQLQKYEAENYNGVAYQTLQKIAHTLQDGAKEQHAPNV